MWCEFLFLSTIAQLVVSGSVVQLVKFFFLYCTAATLTKLQIELKLLFFRRYSHLTSTRSTIEKAKALFFQMIRDTTRARMAADVEIKVPNVGLVL